MDYFLDDAKFKILYNFLQAEKKIHTKKKKKIRLFLEAVFGFVAAVDSGGFCQRNMVNGTAFIKNLLIGVRLAFGKGCLNLWRKFLICKA